MSNNNNNNNNNNDNNNNNSNDRRLDRGRESPTNVGLTSLGVGIRRSACVPETCRQVVDVVFVALCEEFLALRGRQTLLRCSQAEQTSEPFCG